MDDPQQAAAGNNNMLGQMGIDLGDSLGALMPKKADPTDNASLRGPRNFSPGRIRKVSQ